MLTQMSSSLYDVIYPFDQPLNITSHLDDTVPHCHAVIDLLMRC